MHIPPALSMTSLRIGRGSLRCFAFAATVFGCVAPAALAAQVTDDLLAARPVVAARITQPVNDAERTTLRGNVRPFLNLAADEGEVEGNTPTNPIMLIFSRTAEQQAKLDAFTEALHTKGSPEFHHWLTPQQFGAQFSPADSDIAQVRTWLESKGLKVLDVPPSKTFISFTGTVAQLRSAFGVNIHKLTLNGEKHAATLNDPEVPSALATVVGGLRGLDNFNPKPMMTKPVLYRRDKDSGKVYPVDKAKESIPRAALSTSDGNYFVGPQDFYTIYNENPLLSAGITGAGQTIAVIEEALINPADVTSFRSVFGLPAYPATPNATAGGLNILSGSSSGLNGYASCYAPASLTAGMSSGEEGEADLDAEWSGAVAPNATVDFVACGGTSTSPDGTTVGAYGTDHAAQYIVNYLQGSVVAASMSYGECEAAMTSSATSGVGYYNNQWEQFAAEGITAIVSSGDGGSTQCYQNSKYATTRPPSVNGFGSSAWNVAAGGTDFGDLYETNGYTTAPSSTWWSSTNGSGLSSALKYVPETTWAGYCSNPLFASYLQAGGSTTFGTVYNPIAICSSSYSTTNGYTAVVGGAGGVSTYNTIPSWQNVYGVGNNSVSQTYRNVPDISLFAANGFWGHLLPFCESDEAACTSANFVADTAALGAGGTSYVAPQLAGFFALVAQKTGQAQGQANYVLYQLAAQEYGTTGAMNANIANCTGSGVAPTGTVSSSCLFHDISNDMPGLQGGTITADNAQPCKRTSSAYCDGTIGTTNYTYGISVVPGTTATNGVLAYNVGAGYDDATGLGSLNIANVVNNWTGVTGSPVTSAPSIAVTPATTTYTYGSTPASITYTATVTASSTGSFPTGSVAFSGSPTIGSIGTSAIAQSAGCKNGGSCIEAAVQTFAPSATLAPGTYTITGNYSLTNENYVAASGTATITIAANPSTINFSVPSPQNTASTITLAATSNGSGAITYSLVSGPAVLSGSTLTFTGAGQVVVMASQAADATYSATSINTTFTVNAGSVWLGNAPGSASIFDLLGNVVTPAAVTSTGAGTVSAPQTIAFDASGDLWLASTNGVSGFTYNAVPLAAAPYTTGGISIPLALAIDGSSQIWTANSNGTVSVVTTSGTAVSPSTGYTGAGLSTPGGISIDVSGDVWVSNTSDNSVTEILGAAAPALPPSTALANGKTGARP